MLAQLIMLIVMCMQRHWLYAAMLAPSLLGSALMLITMIMRVRHEETNSNTITGSDSPVPTHHNGNEIDHAQLFADMPSISFEHLHGLDNDPLIWRTIVRNWLVRSPTNGIGMSEHGIFHIDLASSGPHAMVAGTTGSGKSELLISWCMALAIRHSPQTLHFVFLDFKGGSTFNALERLPHTVGNVCDLDLAHAVRALNAIEQELARREALVSAERVSRFDQLSHPPARLVVVIDEFHALKDQLPDYVNRLVRIASLGRSLGMYLIACTQNPMGQVSADMKANMSVSICLRVRDRLQSCELLGDGRAADLSPAMPGAAFCNDSEQVTAFRCATARDIDAVCRQIAFASRFVGSPPQPSLFTAPLPRHVKDRTVADHAPQRIRFGLADDGINLREATVSLTGGNIGVIGPQGRGKTTLLKTLARHASMADGLAVRVSSPHRRVWSSQWLHGGRCTPYASSDAPPPPHIVWFVDDADELFDPFRTDEQALSFTHALADESVSVVFAVSTIRPIRIPEHCNTRIVFPCGERTSDLMAGVPARLLDMMSHIDADNAGRAVLIEGTSACLVQCAS